MRATLLLASCLLLLRLPALHTQTITGQLALPDGAPAEYATVTLHHAADSLRVTGTYTDEAGIFALTNLSAGRYYVRASAIGAGQATFPAFDYAGDSLNLGRLHMGEPTTTLGEVTITARRPFIEVQADKTVLNVENSPNSAGLNALDLLRKAPGVTVDNNDNVSIKGKNGIRVFIDGREVRLDARNLATQLKNMQAADIATIDIVSNPSARYDAAGSAGIIHIRLRRSKAQGINGSLGLEGIQGVTPKGGLNAQLNYRKEQLSTFAAYNNHFGRWHNSQFFDREQNGLTFRQNADSYFQSRWNSARLGADWAFSPKHTAGIALNGEFNPGTWVSYSRTAIGHSEKPNSIDSLLSAQNITSDRRMHGGVNLHYQYTDTTGRTLYVDVDQSLYRLENNSRQPNQYFLPDGQTLLQEHNYRTWMPSRIDITTAKADYEQRLWGGAFSAGAKFADVRTDNTFDFFRVKNGLERLDSLLSNRFLYREQTAAAYLNYQRQWGKLNAQAGLRLEHTEYTGALIAFTDQNGSTLANRYTELFPSAALTYAFSEKLGLNATYSRRIDRPSYQDLNPFEFKLDELTYMKGNPRLRPQFTNSWELKPTYKGQPFLTLGYSHTKDMFTQVIDTTQVRATFLTNENIADQRNYSLALQVPTPIARWWEGFISLTGYHTDFSARFREGFVAEQRFSAFNLYGEQTFRLPKGFAVQLSGWYNSRAFWGTLRSDPQGALDLSLQKKCWNDRGQIRLRVGDILRTAAWGGDNLFTPGLRMRAQGTWESQTITLNFSWRFGQADSAKPNRRPSGSQEENRRVKSRN